MYCEEEGLRGDSVPVVGVVVGAGGMYTMTKRKYKGLIKYVENSGFSPNFFFVLKP